MADISKSPGTPKLTTQLSLFWFSDADSGKAYTLRKTNRQSYGVNALVNANGVEYCKPHLTQSWFNPFGIRLA